MHKKLWEHMFDFRIAFSNALDIIRIVNDLSDAADGLRGKHSEHAGVTIKQFISKQNTNAESLWRVGA